MTGLLRESGFLVLDADELAHRALDPEGPAFREVADRWPEVIDGGVIDRRRLARIVFADLGELRALEKIVHPHVLREIERVADETGSGDLAVEVSVPTVGVWEGWTVVVVDAPEDLRRKRLLGRGMDPDDVERRLAVQPSRRQWLAMADHVIENRGDLASLETEVERLLRRLGSREAPTVGESCPSPEGR